LEEAGLMPSLGRVGAPGHNAHMERAIEVLKGASSWDAGYKTSAEVYVMYQFVELQV